MATVEELRVQVSELSRGQFVARYPLGFLVHTPVVPETAQEELDDRTRGGTPRFAFSTKKVDNLGERATATPSDPLAQDVWIIAEVARRPDNPYPDKLSIGRANNCDVIVRYPSVSKLHAYFVLQRNAVAAVVDYQSANGTFVNGRQLPPGGTAPVKLGDKLRFGTLDLDYLPALGMWALATRF